MIKSLNCFDFNCLWVVICKLTEPYPLAPNLLPDFWDVNHDVDTKFGSIKKSDESDQNK